MPDSRASNPVEHKQARVGRIMLAVAATVGIALAVAGSVSPSRPTGLAPDSIAEVNDRPIRREEFKTAITLLARDKRMSLRDEDRAHILDRLIDEELLVQRALDLGLASTDPSVRKALASAIIEAAVIESEAEAVSESELQAFYRDNQDYFTAPVSLRVRRVMFRNDSELGDARERANAVMHEVAAGKTLEEAARNKHDPQVAELPDAMLPLKALRQYVGPTGVEAVRFSKPGHFTDAIEMPYGYQILEVVDVERAPAPEYEEIREQVLAAYMRRRSDQALRAYLGRLRDDARIVIAPEMSP